MIRLQKGGLIREVETEEAAAPYLKMDYEIIGEAGGKDKEGEADGAGGGKKPSRGKGAGAAD